MSDGMTPFSERFTIRTRVDSTTNPPETHRPSSSELRMNRTQDQTPRMATRQPTTGVMAMLRVLLG